MPWRRRERRGRSRGRTKQHQFSGWRPAGSGLSSCGQQRGGFCPPGQASPKRSSGMTGWPGHGAATEPGPRQRPALSHFPSAVGPKPLTPPTANRHRQPPRHTTPRECIYPHYNRIARPHRHQQRPESGALQRLLRPLRSSGHTREGRQASVPGLKPLQSRTETLYCLKAQVGSREANPRLTEFHPQRGRGYSGRGRHRDLLVGRSACAGGRRGHAADPGAAPHPRGPAPPASRVETQRRNGQLWQVGWGRPGAGAGGTGRQCSLGQSFSWGRW